MWIWEHQNWPKFVWNNDELMVPLQNLATAQGRIHGAFSSIPSSESQQAWLENLIEESICTSKIEGETLNLQSIRSSAKRRHGMDFEGTSSDKRCDGLTEVLTEATNNYNALLSKEMILKWHRALFPEPIRGVYRITIGEYRGEGPMHIVSGALGKEKVHFEAPP